MGIPIHPRPHDTRLGDRDAARRTLPQQASAAGKVLLETFTNSFESLENTFSTC